MQRGPSQKTVLTRTASAPLPVFLIPGISAADMILILWRYFNRSQAAAYHIHGVRSFESSFDAPPDTEGALFAHVNLHGQNRRYVPEEAVFS